MQAVFPQDVDKVISFIARSYRTLGRLVGDREDIESEARLAALIAIAKYDESKKIKLSTFVAACVHNHMKDLYRKSMRKKRDSTCIDLGKDAYNPNYELMIDVKRIFSKLSEEDTELFEKILCGYRRDEVASHMMLHYGFTTTKAKRETNKCFSRLCHKLKSIEKSQAA